MRLPSRFIALLSATLVLASASTATGQRPAASGRVPARTNATLPGKTALLVFLENGGVASNFAACKVGTTKLQIPRIPVATCGRLAFALNPGESPLQMVKRAAGIISQNRACMDPTRWSVKSMTFDEWFKLASDYLLEEVTKAIALQQNTRSKYAKVVVLEDAALNPSNALRKVSELVRGGYALDIHVLTHGGNEAFFGGGGARFDDASFFLPAKRIRGLKIRSVYQMNCVSGTLIDNWMDLGAKVVNGTFGTKNNYMPQSYFHFTARWLAGETFQAAVMGAYAEARIYTEPAYTLAGLGQYVIDSRHRVLGDGNCRLTAPDSNPIADAGAVVVKQTTAVLCAGYKAAKKTAEEACALMAGAGCKVNEIARELQNQYKCTAAQVATHLVRANCQIAEVAQCLKNTLKCSEQQIAKYLHDAGCSTRNLARALKDGLSCTAETIAKHLNSAGCTTKNIAIALQKELKCSSKNIAKYLRRAGCGVNAIASTLKKELDCSTKNVAVYLKSAGCSFEEVAKGIWAYGSKSADALKSLVESMIDAFEMNAAQVGASLAKLGIRG